MYFRFIITFNGWLMNWKIVKQLASYQKDGRKAGLLEELVDNFFRDLPDMMDNLRSTFSKKDHQMLERVAHKLKGGSYTIGAQSLGDIFKILEEKGRNTDFTEITSLMDEIEICSATTKKTFLDYIKEQQQE